MKPDKIKIEDLEVFANHGVFPEENVLGQKFVVSAVMYTDTRRAGLTDELTASIHYGEASAFITEYLNVIAGLKSMKIEKGTCTLEVDIESARANPIPLDPYRFSVAVKDVKGEPVYFSDNWDGVRILDAENSLIEQKKLVTLHLEATNFPELKDGQTVVFKYIPIRENSEYSMNWEITKKVYDEFIANQSTSKN